MIANPSHSPLLASKFKSHSELLHISELFGSESSRGGVLHPESRSLFGDVRPILDEQGAKMTRQGTTHASGENVRAAQGPLFSNSLAEVTP